MTKRELRRNPFTDEWVIFSESRQKRPDREKDYCPLCEGSDEIQKFETVMRIANKYPSMSKQQELRFKKSSDFFESINGYGSCELVVYTKEHNSKFIHMSEEQILCIFETWNGATRDNSKFIHMSEEQILCIFETWNGATREAIKDQHLRYILPFENYGEDVGATLSHPHGQIYGFPIVPNEIKKEFNTILAYSKKNSRCMTCDYIRAELEQKERIIYEDEYVSVLVPYFARYSYDIYLYPKRHVSFLFQSTRRELESIVNLLPQLIMAINTIQGKEVSYSLSLVQAPLKENGKLNFHMYFKIHTPQRSPNSLKLLGAVETTSDTYINGLFPEAVAKKISANLHL
ncbi:MAG: galactose-1-phosphate uridylyltransferase [Candidatus Heimdallarchaeaceae archaeon]